MGEVAEKVTEKNISLLYQDTLTNSAEFGLIKQLYFFDHNISNPINLYGYYVVRPNEFVYNPRISKTAPVGPINKNNLGQIGVVSPLYTVFKTHDINTVFLEYFFKTHNWHQYMYVNGDNGARADRFSIKDSVFMKLPVYLPSAPEQRVIANFFEILTSLITLHRRKDLREKEGVKNMHSLCKDNLFHEYYEEWIKVYKEGAIREATMAKYRMTLSWLKRLGPDLTLAALDRSSYQKLLNDYAAVHEKQTTMDFHHQLKGAILDAVDEGLITRDPTRKAIIKGKTPKDKKPKYLNQFELHQLIAGLDLGDEVNWDWFILLVAKTGIRFSEGLAVTPKDFDFARQTLSISKTWNYKADGGFMPTKNHSSNRKVKMDWHTVIQFSKLVKDLPPDKPIFVKGRVFNSTVNDVLTRHCRKSNLPNISIHGLRHTHASLLLFAGVSIASVARRLGHASMTTTQKTYLHIIQELENQDVDLVMRSLSALS